MLADSYGIDACVLCYFRMREGSGFQIFPKFKCPIQVRLSRTPLDVITSSRQGTKQFLANLGLHFRTKTNPGDLTYNKVIWQGCQENQDFG